PCAITVGALNTKGTIGRSDDTVCTYSSRGPTYIDHLAKPDLVAPGNKVVSLRAPGSTLECAYPGNLLTIFSTKEGDGYFTLSGTSMAAPEVAGVAALVIQANPSLSPNAVKAILMYTAQKLALTDAAGLPLSPG